MSMKEKIHNAINDPRVTFFICATPRLKELISAGEHPHVVKMSKWVKRALLDDKALPIAKEDVLLFMEGKLLPEQQFLMSTGDIRVEGAMQVVANTVLAEKEKGA